MQTEFDVIIVGAGLSGIGAAYHLQTRLPGLSYAILEGRSVIGGTWDLFRYPGVRSDSDMFTLGYRFRPWKRPKAIADGPSIREYVQETADAFAIDQKIRFQTRVTKLAWSTDEARWTITADVNGETKTYRCKFLWNCSGYYRYSAGYMPDFPGIEQFNGKVVHPQHWPEGLDYAGKRVVVIGSGATAVTLIPSMADKTEHITMLQRSPTFMFAMPGTSGLANFLGRFLPKSIVYQVMRWQRVLLQWSTFKFARAFPLTMRRSLLKKTRDRLVRDFDVRKHFSPDYNPWDQRICLVPDDDLFEVINDGKASVVTDHIDTFVEDGVRLKSGETLKADIVVTATGLTLELLGGAEVLVDDKPVNMGERLTYRGLMFSNVPNLVSVFGYLNASWTLRADLISDYVCRLLKRMSREGYDMATPVDDQQKRRLDPFADFSSGYITRAAERLPKQSDAPWRHPQDFFVDMLRLRFGPLNDGVLQFGRKTGKKSAPPHMDDRIAA